MPYQARNHEENRKVVCLTCMKKASRQLSSFQADRISKIYQTNIDFSDGRVPQGLCEACRTTFKRKDEGREVALPQLFDFKSIQLKTETRGQELELDSADDSSQSPPQKRFLTQRIAKDSGVKRQILAAVAEDLPENYANVKQLWSLVDANSINYFIATDMKLANILFGLQAHTSSHPCSWCEVDSKNLGNSGALRSFGSLRACLKAFENSGSDLSKAKFFGNVVHDSIVRGSDETLIIDVLPPMELHLLLGIVNHLFKALIAVWQNAERWPASLNIEMSEYHSGQFEGNNCRKLLNNVDTLQRLAESMQHSKLLALLTLFESSTLLSRPALALTLKMTMVTKLINSEVHTWRCSTAASLRKRTPFFIM